MILYKVEFDSFLVSAVTQRLHFPCHPIAPLPTIMKPS